MWLLDTEDPTRPRKIEKARREISELQSKLETTKNKLNELEIQKQRAGEIEGAEEKINKRLAQLSQQIDERRSKLAGTFEWTRRRLDDKIAALTSLSQSSHLPSELLDFRAKKQQMAEEIRQDAEYAATTADGQQARALRALIEEYEKIQQWNEKTVNAFVKEYSAIKAGTQVPVSPDLEEVASLANEWSPSQHSN